MTLGPMDLLLIVGLSARITRLAVFDDAGVIIRLPIHKLGSLFGRRGVDWADGLLECPFCFGFWASVFAASSWYLWAGTLWQAAAAAATASYIVGQLAQRMDQQW
jgi:hypothetical protein